MDAFFFKYFESNPDKAIILFSISAIFFFIAVILLKKYIPVIFYFIGRKLKLIENTDDLMTLHNGFNQESKSDFSEIPKYKPVFCIAGIHIKHSGVICTSGKTADYIDDLMIWSLKNKIKVTLNLSNMATGTDDCINGVFAIIKSILIENVIPVKFILPDIKDNEVFKEKILNIYNQFSDNRISEIKIDDGRVR